MIVKRTVVCICRYLFFIQTSCQVDHYNATFAIMLPTTDADMKSTDYIDNTSDYLPEKIVRFFLYVLYDYSVALFFIPQSKNCKTYAGCDCLPSIDIFIMRVFKFKNIVR